MNGHPAWIHPHVDDLILSYETLGKPVARFRKFVIS
jgi:hypothetical protein